MAARSGEPAAPVPEEPSYEPSKYSRSLSTYSRVQIRQVMPFLASISRTCGFSPLYPTCKVLKTVSKIFMLNEIEVVFLAYLIRETEWNVRDKTINHEAAGMQDLIGYSSDNPDYKRILLYLMVTAFTVKFYLNDSTGELLEEA
jgi:hypothetical protein